MRSLALLLASASVAYADAPVELHGVASVGYTSIGLPATGTTVTTYGPVLELGVAEPAWPDTTVGIALAYSRLSFPAESFVNNATVNDDRLSIDTTLEHRIGRFSFGAELGMTVVFRGVDDPAGFASYSTTGVLLGAGAHVALDIVGVGRGKAQVVLGGRVEPWTPDLLAGNISETFATITLGVGYRL
jgi:hypothetical protein